MIDKHALRDCPQPPNATSTQPADAGDSARCCVDCGDLIPEGRLDAMPEARRCVECQKDIEAMGKWDWGMSE